MNEPSLCPTERAEVASRETGQLFLAPSLPSDERFAKSLEFDHPLVSGSEGWRALSPGARQA